MQILSFDIWGLLRSVFLRIDSIAYILIDDLYNLIYSFSKGSIINSEAISKIRNGLYVVIGLFAIFKMGVALVNAMVSPDKLFEKETGYGAVAKNFLIMFVLLLITPLLFSESYKVQKTIVQGNYIQKLLSGAGVKSIDNPGFMMKKAAITSLVYPDERYATKEGNLNEVEYVPNDACNNKCKQAIEDYNKVISNEENKDLFSPLADNVDVSDKIGDPKKKVYVYNYIIFLTFIVGIVITWVLAGFVFDVAERVFKLAILEIISPLFIVTFIDPKSSKSGPFKNWIREVGSTYASLYIKLAILELMIIFLGFIGEIDTKTLDLGPMGYIVLILALLIFVKKFPGWICALVGVKESESGIGGLGKRLGSAALIGGVAGRLAAGGAVGSVATAGRQLKNLHEQRKKAREDAGLNRKERRNMRNQEYEKNRRLGKSKKESWMLAKNKVKDKKNKAYKDANIGNGLKQFGGALLGGAIAGAQAGINGGNLKGAVKASLGASADFSRQAGMSGESIKEKALKKVEDLKERQLNKFGNPEERRQKKKEQAKRENMAKYLTSEANNMFDMKSLPILSQGDMNKTYKGLKGDSTAIAAELGFRGENSEFRNSQAVIEDGKIKLSGTNGNVAVIDGNSGQVTVQDKSGNVIKNEDYGKLSNKGFSYMSDEGKAQLNSMLANTQSQAMNDLMANNQAITNMNQQITSGQQNMQFNKDLALGCLASAGIALGGSVNIGGADISLSDVSMDKLKQIFTDSNNDLSKKLQSNPNEFDKFKDYCNNYASSEETIKNIYKEKEVIEKENAMNRDMINFISEKQIGKTDVSLETIKQFIEKEKDNKQQIADSFSNKDKN